MIYLLSSPTLPKISLFSRVISSIYSETLWMILFLVWVTGLDGAYSGFDGRSWGSRFLTVSSSSPDFLLILCSKSLQPILKNLYHQSCTYAWRWVFLFLCGSYENHTCWAVWQMMKTSYVWNIWEGSNFKRVLYSWRWSYCLHRSIRWYDYSFSIIGYDRSLWWS